MNILIYGSYGNISETLLHAFTISSSLAHYSLFAYLKPDISSKVKQEFASTYSHVTFINDISEFALTLHQSIDILVIIPPTERCRVSHVNEIALLVNTSVRIKFVLLLSVLEAHLDTNLWISQYHDMEETISSTGTPYCILRAGIFYETLVAFAPLISQGILSIPIDSRKFAPISIDDICILSAHIICNYKEYPDSIVSCTGPDLVSGIQIARMLGSLLERRVMYIPFERMECKFYLEEHRGMDPWLADGFTSLFDFIAEGKVEFTQTDHFRTALKCEPIGFNQFLMENFSVFEESPYSNDAKFLIGGKGRLRIETQMIKMRLTRIEKMLEELLNKSQNSFEETCEFYQ